MVDQVSSKRRTSVLLGGIVAGAVVGAAVGAAVPLGIDLVEPIKRFVGDVPFFSFAVFPSEVAGMLFGAWLTDQHQLKSATEEVAKRYGKNRQDIIEIWNKHNDGFNRIRLWRNKK